MIPKSGYRFPACAKPRDRFVVSFDASAGEGKSEKIMRQIKMVGARVTHAWQGEL
jgi:hypothetical protein